MSLLLLLLLTLRQTLQEVAPGFDMVGGSGSNPQAPYPYLNPQGSCPCTNLKGCHRPKVLIITERPYPYPWSLLQAVRCVTGACEQLIAKLTVHMTMNPMKSKTMKSNRTAMGEYNCARI